MPLKGLLTHPASPVIARRPELRLEYSPAVHFPCCAEYREYAFSTPYLQYQVSTRQAVKYGILLLESLKDGGQTPSLLLKV
jgi:hypothetical protein